MTKPLASKSTTRRGLPVDYAGGDPLACNALTLSGKPCRAKALESGKCMTHGGSGIYPRSRVTSLRRAKQKLAAMVQKIKDRDPGFDERVRLIELKREATEKAEYDDGSSH